MFMWKCVCDVRKAVTIVLAATMKVLMSKRNRTMNTNGLARLVSEHRVCWRVAIREQVNFSLSNSFELMRKIKLNFDFNSGLGTSLINSTNADEDEDLNVDGDDTQIYGQSQYSERDVIVPAATTNKEANENLYLRQLVVGEDLKRPTGQRSSKNGDDDDDDNDGDDEMNGNVGESSDLKQETAGESSSSTINTNNTTTNPFNSKNNQHQVIESLKEKIREFETQKNNKCKCLICMDAYVDPVVSICCWHVHCEECWLRTLGARKLCPQCNMITSPSDLRRIYM